MIVYRIGDELHLIKIRNGRTEDILIYDGSYGPPDRFSLNIVANQDTYASIDRERMEYDEDYDPDNYRNEDGQNFFGIGDGAEVYYVLIYRPGLILINIGDINKLSECVWISYETNREDYPIAGVPVIDIEEDDAPINIVFVYEDTSYIAVKFERDESMLFTQGDSEERDGIKLPIYLLSYVDSNSVFVSDSNKPYTLNIIRLQDGTYDLNFRKIRGIKRNDEKLIQYNKYELYEDGTFINNESKKISDVTKISKSGHLFLTSDKVLHIRNDEVLGITNFYIDEEEFWSPIYVINGDMLLQIIRGSGDDYKIIIERGASNIRFQTDTSYDIDLNRVSRFTKSARK